MVVSGLGGKGLGGRPGALALRQGRHLGWCHRPALTSGHGKGVSGEGLAGQEAGKRRLGFGLTGGGNHWLLLGMVRRLQLPHLQPLVMGNDQEHGQPVALPEQGIANRLEIDTLQMNDFGIVCPITFFKMASGGSTVVE